MSYYIARKPPELRTRAVQVTRSLGPPMPQPGRLVVTAPTWLGAQTGAIGRVRPRLWNRIPVALAEGTEPIPWWDVIPNRGL